MEDKLTDKEKIEYYLDTFNAISKIIGRIPPSYAYGDNEAGCYMANLLEEIDTLVNNL